MLGDTDLEGNDAKLNQAIAHISSEVYFTAVKITNAIEQHPHDAICLMRLLDLLDQVKHTARACLRLPSYEK